MKGRQIRDFVAIKRQSIIRGIVAGEMGRAEKSNVTVRTNSSSKSREIFSNALFLPYGNVDARFEFVIHSSFSMRNRRKRTRPISAQFRQIYGVRGEGSTHGLRVSRVYCNYGRRAFRYNRHTADWKCV